MTVAEQLHEQFLRLTAVIIMTGKPRSSIYADMKSGDFPEPVRIGKRCVAWKLSEIKIWQESCAIASKAHGVVVWTPQSIAGQDSCVHVSQDPCVNVSKAGGAV